MTEYYAIEIIGYGANRRFCIKNVIKEDGRLGSTTILATNGRTYSTEERARRAAEAMGLDIKLVGDFYQIL